MQIGVERKTIEQQITDDDSSLAKTLERIKAELKEAENSVVSLNEKAGSKKLTDAFSKTGEIIQQVKNQANALRGVFERTDQSDVESKQRVIAAYEKIAETARQYGVTLRPLVSEEMNMNRAMSMQSATIEQMIQKQKALVEARAKENVSTKQGRQNVADINAEYNRLNSRLQDFGVKQRRVNDQLLGQSRILSQR